MSHLILERKLLIFKSCVKYERIFITDACHGWLSRFYQKFLTNVFLPTTYHNFPFVFLLFSFCFVFLLFSICFPVVSFLFPFCFLSAFLLFCFPFVFFTHSWTGPSLCKLCHKSDTLKDSEH